MECTLAYSELLGFLYEVHFFFGGGLGPGGGSGLGAFDMSMHLWLLVKFFKQ